ncbi:MAG: alpha-mannosidase [Acidobacteria bacterium]|nr:alpha-mannosidase [Acidobacteriota bacterium]
MILLVGGAATAQAKPAAPAAPAKPAGAARAAVPDLAKTPTLYVVNYAHLDTEWRWEYPQVINEYLTKTLRNNFALFEKYPHYVFNFTGANRYAMMKEYFPEDFARLKRYVALGRWFPAGSSIEESDVNSPSAESIFRQVLYGNEFFRREFGKYSNEYMLPDCFGFPASLPSILAHAGIKGFSTQKLSSGWQPAPRVGGPDSPERTPEGIPFNVGIWEGTDGKTVIAALNPSSYGTQVYADLSRSNAPIPNNEEGGEYVWDWPARVDFNGKVTGVYADYHYVGTGDTGGSPHESSVRLLEAIQTRASMPLPPVPLRRDRNTGKQELYSPGPDYPCCGTGPLRVLQSNADQMFLDIKPGETARMPRYKGDLELINHSAGSITSEGYQKRWNRENELLADAAEKASVAAAWLGGRAYPQERLNRAWRLVLGGQFHDIMAGTATPKSYEYAWNDDVLAMNQFAGVLTSGTEAVASVMDTQAQGTPVVVFNPLNIERAGVVEAEAPGDFTAARVIGPDGQETPSQVVTHPGGSVSVLFVARVPSVGYAVYDVQQGAGAAAASELKVAESSLENARYRVSLDHNGDVFSIFDKKLDRELLSGPLRLAISTDNPEHWPAWNMDFEDEQRAPRDYVSGTPEIRIVESGPARVAIEVTRQTEGSRFSQTVRLGAGAAGERVEFVTSTDWQTKNANLKAVFPLAAANPKATYNWDVGVVERPNEEERQFEVATHQWIDLTDQSGAYGATVLTDKKYGSDKPDDHTIRLTLIRTPGTRGGYADQGTQDIGHHDIVYGLAGHEGDWRKGEGDWQAYSLNTPLFAFISAKHAGKLGRSFSLLKTSSRRVRVLAVKKAEESDETIVRLVDISGQQQPEVQVAFAAPLTAAREVNAQEQSVGPAGLKQGALVAAFSPWQPRTFAVRLGAAAARAPLPVSQPVALHYDASVATADGRPGTGCFDCSSQAVNAPQGNALPAEMLPNELSFAGVRFSLAPAGKGTPNAVTAMGQRIALPAGNFNRVYLLAASYSGGSNYDGAPRLPNADVPATFKAGSQAVELIVQNWTGFVGQWDDRLWQMRSRQVPINRPANAGPLPPGAPATRTVTAMEFTGQLVPGFIKRADVAWFASHRHGDDGSNQAYEYSYLFAYPLDVPAGAKEITLPDNEHIRILAITAVNEAGPIRPAYPLYDVLAGGPTRQVSPPMTVEPE